MSGFETIYSDEWELLIVRGKVVDFRVPLDRNVHTDFSTDYGS